MASKILLPPVPGMDMALHYTAVIPGGYHGLYDRLSPETRAMVDEWVQYATELLPSMGYPILSERNLRGTVMQAAIVANGHEPVTKANMLDAVIRGHHACIEHRLVIRRVIATVAANHPDIDAVAEHVGEDLENYRGKLDPTFSNVNTDVVGPLIHKYLLADGYTGD